MRAAFFHGTNDGPEANWYPWLVQQLESKGYEVFAPLLPNNHKPNRKVYELFLKDSQWDFSDNVLFGHSSGATTILNLLQADWFPRVKACVLVSTFLNEKWTRNADWVEPGQFDNLFLPQYKPRELMRKCQNFYFVHSDDDPFCDIEDAKLLCAELGGTFTTIKNGHHLGSTWGKKEFPELVNILNENNLI